MPHWDILLLGLKYRAQISCLHCERLRNNGKFVCGRCGDIYWTKPVVPAPGDETEGTHQHEKKKAISEPNWNVPPEHGIFNSTLYFLFDIIIYIH